MNSLLMLPDHPEFHKILAVPPPSREHGINFAFRSGSDVLEPLDKGELNEYLEGGEYDQRLQDIQSEWLWLPVGWE